MKQSYKFLALAFGLLGVQQTHAQLINCNAFMQGNYIELGVNSVGAFGTAVDQPAGYHGNSNPTPAVLYCDSPSLVGGSHGLGFIADPDMDGWSVGTPPFFGDYFLPGTPYEGWSIQINGSRADAYTTGSGSTGTLTGTNISDTLIGGTYTTIWQGMMDSVQITQVISLDTGNLYFTVNVTLTNTSSSPVDNIYYVRSVDPDNDEMEPGGGFPTNNYVRSQCPDTSYSLVVATAADSLNARAYLGIGSTDTNSRVYVFTSWPPSATGDLGEIYNETETFLGTTYFAMGDSAMNEDIAIGIVFSVPHLAPLDSASIMVNDRTTSMGMHPANSKTMSYFYSFSKAATDSVVHATMHTTAIKNVNTQTITAYPNPVRNTLKVSGLATGDQVQLVDMMGNTVTNWTAAANDLNTFGLENVSAGAYLLIVTDAQGATKARTHMMKN